MGSELSINYFASVEIFSINFQQYSVQAKELVFNVMRFHLSNETFSFKSSQIYFSLFLVHF